MYVYDILVTEYIFFSTYSIVSLDSIVFFSSNSFPKKVLFIV